MTDKQQKQFDNVDLRRAELGDYMLNKSRAKRDIGTIPACVNPERREKASKDFGFFCKTYFPEIFILDWSPDHIKSIKKMKQAVKTGGLFSFAMPRGSGKSSLCKALVLYALLYGYRKFVVIVASEAGHASDMMTDIKIMIETSATLMEDFPEVVIPIQALEGSSKRAISQTSDGERTRMEYGKDELTLPTIEGSAASGGTVMTFGMMGRIRGTSKTIPSGETLRPDFVVVDDPQTDESAYSEQGIKKRLAVINKAILPLAGIGKPPIAGILPCTVIRKGDLADQLLNTAVSPAWQGNKFKLLYKFPTNKKLWEEYKKIYFENIAKDGTFTEATKFYSDNKTEMDKGAVVGWEDRYNVGEISALQNAMNLFIFNEESFYSEYQNEPLDETTEISDGLKLETVMKATNGLKRREVPVGTVNISMHIDVGADHLHYSVVSFDNKFNAAVIDYGIYPGGNKSLREHKGDDIDSSIVKGLNYLNEKVIKRTYHGEEGEYKIGLCLVDSGYKPDAVNTFIKFAGNHNIIEARGLGMKETDVPITERKMKPGQVKGFHWYRDRVHGKPRYYIDSSRWKTKLHNKLGKALGQEGGCTLWGDGDAGHYEYAYAITKSEFAETKISSKGIVMEVWKKKPVENHFFDTLYSALAGCSILGAFDATDAFKARQMAERRPKTLKELAMLAKK